MNDEQPHSGSRWEPAPTPGSAALPPPSAYPPLNPARYVAPPTPRGRPRGSRGRLAVAALAGLLAAGTLGGYAVGHVITSPDLSGQPVQQPHTAQPQQQRQQPQPQPQPQLGDDNGAEGADTAYDS